jgi:hypothetical protein
MNATEEASFPAMRRRDEETDDDDIVASNDSSIIRETLRLYGSFYLCCFLLYCVLRRRYPLLFNVRSWVPELECELAKREYGLFDWFWKVFGFTDEEIFKDCGMDAMCFLRALRMGRKLSLCGCFCAVWLIPLYATATESSETTYLNNTWDEISVSNLPSSSARFVATVLASYIVFFYSMYLLFHEFKWYTKWRHKFLAKPWSRNYAVYVSGIPLAFRSSSQLAEYFRQCSSKEAVIEAHVAMDTPGLESKVARREFVVRNLEHAVALERKTGGTKTHRRVGFRRGLEKVESVSEYEAELRELNRYIERSIGELILTRDRSRCKLNQNAATFIMTGSQEWIGEDSANDYADFQVLSSVNCMNSEESESETDPLVNVLPAVPREEYIALNMHREEGTMAAVAEDITILYGDDGDYKDTPAVLSMHREKGGISEDDRPGLKELMGTVSVASVSDEKDTLARVFSDPENEIEFGPREVGDDAILFSPDVSSREPPSRADSAWNTRSNASSVSSSSSILPDSESKISRDASQASHSIASSSHEIGQAMKKAVKELKPDKLIQTAHDKGADTIKKAKEVGNIIVATTGAVVPMILTKSEGKSTSAGFVLFSSLYAATSVIQMVHHPKPGAMDVQEAPDPDDIFWKSVGLEQHILRTGRVVSLAASAVLCFFWSVPMAFISSLTEVHSLKETMPALGRWIEDHPRSEAVFEQIAPLLLLFFNTVILPGFLKLFATWEGLISSRMLEASLFVKLGAFMVRFSEWTKSCGINEAKLTSFRLSHLYIQQIIQTFFVSAISGGIAGIYGYESRSMYHLARGLYLTLLLSCTVCLFTQPKSAI